uniref:Putative ovule protein n=1 Tax=Solanum chacoense TaxID=4108 RepID=A0A0V0HEY2_SOLCH
MVLHTSKLASKVLSNSYASLEGQLPQCSTWHLIWENSLLLAANVSATNIGNAIVASQCTCIQQIKQYNKLESHIL